MSLESVRAWLAEHAPDLPLIEVEESTATVETAAKALGRRAGRIAKSLAVRAGDADFPARRARRCPARQWQDQGGVRRPAADARRGGDVGADRPSGRRRLPVRTGDGPAGLSRPVAGGVRHRLSGGRVAQHVGRSLDANGCSTSSATAGSTYAAYPRKRAGLSSSAATVSIGQGVPAISASTIAAIAGEV